MSRRKEIPIIDLFAGPGGLGEGFSSYETDNKFIYRIKLCIEKDEHAHSTLLFRAFYRQFEQASIPEAYYDCFRETDLDRREDKIAELFNAYPDQYSKAKEEALRATLGEDDSDVIDQKIKMALGGSTDWLLIGGPPCQAYSMVGRSRVGGIDKEDHRVYLYREYLRILAVHQPRVFVMENVKGLLSARVGNEYVFDWMLNDLSHPSDAIEGVEDCPRYRIYSLSTRSEHEYRNGNPIYRSYSDYLIKSEQFGIPQKRHRVILLGIREDVDKQPGTLRLAEKPTALRDVLADLPRIRSRLGKRLRKDPALNGSGRYEQLTDSTESWNEWINTFNDEIAHYNGMEEVARANRINGQLLETGAEFMPTRRRKLKVLAEWYQDKRIGGVANHISRSHLLEDLRRYLFASLFLKHAGWSPKMTDFEQYADELLPEHRSAKTGNFVDRFKVQKPGEPASTITSHISKDGHYFIHYDPTQCRSLTVREAARVQTFPDNYLFRGSRTAQYHQVGNAVPPLLANQIAQVVAKLFK
jgi:DNA (cytosine-5)-methyltransferase 1